jgi:hypothetical protein
MFSKRDEVVAVLDRLESAVDELTALQFDALTTPERLRILERLETVNRRLPVAGHALINGVRQQATQVELGGKLAHALADRLHITRTEATRRIREAEDLGERQALTGEPLPPRLSATAAGQPRHAHHYLAIFDKGKAVALYHTKRLASPGQRIVLYAKDRGCSHPGCDVAGYYCEVHHVTEYAKSRVTDVNDLTLGCGGHHPIVKPGGWQTRKRKDGHTEWIPPPHLERGQPRINLFHHPEKLLRDGDEDDDDRE